MKRKKGIKKNFRSGNSLDTHIILCYYIKNKSLNGKEWFLKLFLAISENFHNNNEITIKYNTFETLMNCDKLKNLSDTLYNSIEFSYNNSYQASIQMAPFEALYGR